MEADASRGRDAPALWAAVQEMSLEDRCFIWNMFQEDVKRFLWTTLTNEARDEVFFASDGYQKLMTLRDLMPRQDDETWRRNDALLPMDQVMLEKLEATDTLDKLKVLITQRLVSEIWNHGRKNTFGPDAKEIEEDK